jgi:hypothetical protein
VRRALHALYGSVIELRVRDYDNHIFAASTRALDPRALRAAIAADPTLAATLAKLRVRAV